MRRAFASVTLKPTRWASFITPIISFWFEVGRVELLRQLGFSYRDMERETTALLPSSMRSAVTRLPCTMMTRF